MRIRFATRDLLWLFVLAAILLGWGIDHWRLVRPGPYTVTVSADGSSAKLQDNTTGQVWIRAGDAWLETTW